MRALLVLLGLLLLAVPADAGPREEKELADAASAYLDPEVEFLWKPRKRFIEALDAVLGEKALADIAGIRQVVYQGRHFLPRFSDKTWQRDPQNDVTEFKKDGPYRHVVSERYRFSYALPRKYPKERAFGKTPRIAAYPLLLSIHEARDTRDAKGEAETYPGGAGLKRKYPRSAFGALYERWLMVAPVAARAKFLEEGAIRHRYLTGVLTNFWRRYHVDFDRIVVDGTAPAAAMAAAFPNVFAGLVLRAGTTVESDLVRNYASVPVFVVDDVQLARALKEHGHPDVSSGDDATLGDWLGARRRLQTRTFHWRWKRPDHRSAHWVVLTDVDHEAPRVDLAVDAGVRNTIRIETRGVRTVTLFLSDEIVDLDQPVRLVVNDEVRKLGVLGRDFGRLFEKDPEVHTNMNFGWLYTALVEDVRVGPAAPDAPEQPQAGGPRGSAEDEAKAEKLWGRAETAAAEGSTMRAELYYEKILDLGETSYRQPTEGRLAALRLHDVSLPDRLAAQEAWLKGRPDEIDEHLGPADEARTAMRLLPFALRDLWWRLTPGTNLRERIQAVVKGLEGPLADQLRWILAGGGAPYPTFPLAAEDPWPVLTALVLERQMRETTGARWLPDESPVVRRKVLDAPEEWQDWYTRWNQWFYETYMRSAYEGEDIERLSEATQEADAKQARHAEEVRIRNGWLAVLAGLLFVAGALITGRRLARP